MDQLRTAIEGTIDFEGQKLTEKITHILITGGVGLDLSTQQLKGILIDQDTLKPVCHSKVEFDVDLGQYNTKKGVYSNEETKEVQAPVVMWLDAIDLLFDRLSKQIDLGRVKGISGACQQHGSVFWNENSDKQLGTLSGDGGVSLKSQLEDCFAWDRSPNWQDHSTAEQCKQFEDCVGGKEELARITGSKAHRRFTGPQILKLKTQQSELYDKTTRIALVSSFLASVIAGQHAPLDIGDVCGMNLWDVEQKQWHSKLMNLVDSDSSLAEKLGPVDFEGKPFGRISQYFVKKYGMDSQCQVAPFTGDNPGTILSLPLETNDVIVSLGTSTTALVVTEKYVPSSLYHLFSHPVGKGYMGMLCYCNGSLAREQVRDEINKKYQTEGWDKFNDLVQKSNILGDNSHSGIGKIGFYFPLSEIIPDVQACIKRFLWRSDSVVPEDAEDLKDEWVQPDDDALAILESQALSIRHRLQPMLTKSRPRRVYFVGGASANTTICQAFTKVLVPEQGAYTLDLTDACAIGAANKVAWACSGQGEPWESFIASKWNGSFTPVPDSTIAGDAYKNRNGLSLFVSSENFL